MPKKRDTKTRMRELIEGKKKPRREGRGRKKSYERRKR